MPGLLPKPNAGYHQMSVGSVRDSVGIRKSDPMGHGRFYLGFFYPGPEINSNGLRTLARWTVARRTDARRTLARATRVRNKQ